jgi:hypothetical protein
MGSCWISHVVSCCLWESICYSSKINVSYLEYLGWDVIARVQCHVMKMPVAWAILFVNRIGPCGLHMRVKLLTVVQTVGSQIEI